MNELISIFIPTFNRCLILDANLSHIVPIAKMYNIGIYIYDNASSDSTNLMIEKYQLEYSYLYYIRNKENIGIDRNMLHCLECSCSKYILMLGDDDCILDNFYIALKKFLDESYDFIVLSQNKVDSTRIFTDCQDAFEFLWSKMPYGTLIIKNGLLRSTMMNKYIGTSHAYSAIPWEMMSFENHESKCLFFSSELVVKLGVVEKTWKADALNIYLYQIPLWFSLLPQKIHVKKIKQAYMSNVLSFKSLFILRKSCDFSLLKSKEYLSRMECLKIEFVDLLFRMFNI